MLCIDDPSAIQLQGTGYTFESVRLYISLNRCVGKEICRSEEEIDDALRSTTAVGIYNTYNLKVNTFGERSDFIHRTTLVEHEVL